MVDRVEAEQAHQDEIDRDYKVQQSRNDQDQNAGDQSDERRDVSDGEDHFRAPGMVKVGLDKNYASAGVKTVQNRSYQPPARA